MLQTLRFGSTGAEAAFLQTALRRYGLPLSADGVFGSETQRALMKFQTAAGLAPDGIAGKRTYAALQPWLTGYTLHTVRPGDSLWSISRRYDTTLLSMETANPDLDPFRLRVGTRLTVPLAFPVVPTDIPWCSALAKACARGLAMRYPSIRSESIGKSVLGRDIHSLTMGSGPRRVIYNAAHHANEWITTPVLFRFAEELMSSAARGGTVFGYGAEELLRVCTVTVIPMVDPDGVDLVTGALEPEQVRAAAGIASAYPGIPFPAGWKANIRGVDLNLQYPAGWEQARKNKFAEGFVSPAPRDYVGEAPLTAPESRAMADYTKRESPALTLALHSQGQVIYWRYLDREVPYARRLGERFAAVSGYALEDTPYASGFAGYKDWFIDIFGRPGYTVEVGLGENPLPLSQLDAIYAQCRGILVTGMAGG